MQKEIYSPSDLQYPRLKNTVHCTTSRKGDLNCRFCSCQLFSTHIHLFQPQVHNSEIIFSDKCGETTKQYTYVTRFSQKGTQ